MATERLTAWEIAALECSLERGFADGVIAGAGGGDALLRKLRIAVGGRLTVRGKIAA
jgi:hypothetical protein